jgi:hypothetical protein
VLEGFNPACLHVCFALVVQHPPTHQLLHSTNTRNTHATPPSPSQQPPRPLCRPVAGGLPHPLAEDAAGGVARARVPQRRLHRHPAPPLPAGGDVQVSGACGFFVGCATCLCVAVSLRTALRVVIRVFLIASQPTPSATPITNPVVTPLKGATMTRLCGRRRRSCATSSRRQSRRR